MTTKKLRFEMTDHATGSSRAEELLKRLNNVRIHAKYKTGGILGFRSRLDHDKLIWFVEVDVENSSVQLPSLPGARWT